MAQKQSISKHLYDNSELDEMIRVTAREGKVFENGFCVVERDMSEKGNVAWSLLFTLLAEDVSLANPTLPATILVMYNHWGKYIKDKLKSITRLSYTIPEARPLLVSASTLITKSLKTRICADGAIVGLLNPIDDVLSFLEAKDDVIDKPAQEELQRLISWVHDLGPIQAYKKIFLGKKDSITAVDTEDDEDGNEDTEDNLNNEHDVNTQVRKGLNAEKVLTAFVLLLQRVQEVWTSYKSVSFSATMTKEEKQTELEELKTQISVLETNLLCFCNMIYAIDSIEKRKVSNPNPTFVNRAFAEFKDFAKSRGEESSWGEELYRISKKTDFYSRPLFWAWGILIEKMLKEKKEGEDDNHQKILVTLLVLLEVCARKIGNDRYSFIAAVLLFVRCHALSWDPVDVDIADLSHIDPQATKVLDLYTFHGSVDTSNFDAKTVAQRRLIAIPVESKYVNKNTLRGKGRDTVPLLKKYCEQKNCKITEWTDSEIAKSHGPGRTFSKNRQLQTSCSQKAPLTAVSHYVHEVCQLSTCPDGKHFASENIYLEKSNELQLLEEEKFGAAKCNLKNMTNRIYGHWINTSIMEKLPFVNDKKSASTGNTVQKADTATKKSKEIKKKPQPKKSQPKKSAKKKNHSDEDEESDEDYCEERDDDEDLPEEDEGEEKRSAVNRKKKNNTDVAASSTKKKKKHTESSSNTEDEPPAKKSKTSKEASVPKTKKTTVSSSSASKTKTKTKTKEKDTESIKKKTKEEPKTKPTKKATGKPPSNDTLSKLTYQSLLPEEMLRIQENLVAQKPSTPSKKFVFITPTHVYKGPYSLLLDSHVQVVQRVLYRLFLLNLFEHHNVLPHELVHDPEHKQLYFKSPNVAPVVDQKQWKISKMNIESHGGKTIHIVDRDTVGLTLVAKMVDKPAFKTLFSDIVYNLGCRYLCGMGESHLSNLIYDGKKMYAVDFDENRETLPLVDDKPTFFEGLFIHGRGPSKVAKEKFIEILYDPATNTADTLTRLIKKAQSVLFTSEPSNESKDAPKSPHKVYAESIGYKNFITDKQFKERIATLEYIRDKVVKKVNKKCLNKP